MVSRTRERARTLADNHSGASVQTAAPAGPMKVTVDEEVLRRLYARMLRARFAGNGRKNGFSSLKLAEIGALIDLLPGDAVAPPAGNTAIQAALAASDGVHTLPPHLGLAAGVALGFKLHPHQNVVVVMTDAGALDAGSAHEALTSAAAEKLPLVVVVDCSDARSGLEARAAAYGIPAIAVDGSDAVAVYRVSREAINRARSGRGPSLLECQAIASDLDTITRMEHYLEKHGWWTPEWKRQLTSTKHQSLSTQP